MKKTLLYFGQLQLLQYLEEAHGWHRKQIYLEEYFLVREAKQLAYLKEHEEEIKDFVKSQNPKIESVQIDWRQTQWDKVGNGTPQGGGDIIDVYGTFNNIDNSGWHAMIIVDDGKVDLASMTLVNGLGIGGKPFE